MTQSKYNRMFIAECTTMRYIIALTDLSIDAPVSVNLLYRVFHRRDQW